jgi:hypothetical protein
MGDGKRANITAGGSITTGNIAETVTPPAASLFSSPATAENVTPLRKPGRRPNGVTAMTGAERQKRYREKRIVN